MSTLLPSVKFASQQKAAYRSTALFCSRKPGTERRLAGVGFMLRTSIASKLEDLPYNSDRTMSIHFPLRNKQYATLFSVYTPTLQAEPAEKDKFYSELPSFLQNTPADEKLLILGSFNARVGQDAVTWKGILGRHGVGDCNNNGRLLLEFCTKQQLVITNTIFQQKDILKTIWMHFRSKHWCLIDYVLERQRDFKKILHTRVIPSADFHTDHRLVRCKLNLHFKPKPRKRGPPKIKSKINKLQSAEVKADYQADLHAKLGNNRCPEDPFPKTLWNKLKTTILQTSEEVLGLPLKGIKTGLMKTTKRFRNCWRRRDQPTSPTWPTRPFL